MTAHKYAHIFAAMAEAAEKYLTKKGIGNVLLYDGLFNALRAAGYLK